MKIKFLIWMPAFLLLLACASASTELISYDQKCYNDGSFSFFAKNGKDDPLNLSETKIYVYNPYTREGFTPKGEWSQEIIYLRAGEPEKFSSQYISEEAAIPEKGDYQVSVSYHDCRSEPNCKIGFALDKCPGYDEACRKYGMTILSCNVDKGELFVRFKGNDLLYFNKLDLSKNLIYYVKSTARDFMGKPFLPRMTLKPYDKSSYMLTMPLAKAEEISEVAILHRDCDSPVAKKMFSCIEGPLEDVQKVEVSEGAQEEIEDAEFAEAVEEASGAESTEEPEPGTEEGASAKKAVAEEILEYIPEKTDTNKIEDSETAETQKKDEGVSYKKKIVPFHLIILILIVMIGLFLLFFTNFLIGRKKKKEDEEEFDRSFGFGK